jgi:hypothetical protein
MRDGAVVRFHAFVDAAFLRNRGTHTSAVQQVSPIRSFASFVFAEAETVLSPQPDSTIKERTKRTSTLEGRTTALVKIGQDWSALPSHRST